MKKLTLLLVFFAYRGAAQDCRPEQVAIGYFIDNIFSKEYPQQLKFRFNGKTQVKFTRFGIRENCYDKYDDVLYSRIDSSANEATKMNMGAYSLDKSVFGELVRKHSKNELRVYRATRVKGRFYIEILINFASNRSDSFFVEIDDNCQILRYCKTSLIY